MKNKALREKEKLLRAFHHIMQMLLAMFDELVERLRPRLTKPMTDFRPNSDPGLKVALTLRYLASGATYSTHGGCPKGAAPRCQISPSRKMHLVMTYFSRSVGLTTACPNFLRCSFPYQECMCFHHPRNTSVVYP